MGGIVAVKNYRITKIILLLVLLLLVYSKTLYANPTENMVLEESISEQLNALELQELTRYIDLVDPDYHEYLPDLNIRNILNQGLLQLDLLELVRGLIARIFKEILLSSYLMRQLLVVALLSAFFRQLQASFGSKGITDLAYTVCFLVIVFIGLQSFRTALTLASSSLNDMVSFMYALLPTMSTMLAAVGGITSATIFHPVLIAVVGGIASLIRTILFPMLNVSAVIGLLANIAPDYPLTRLSGLIRHGCTMLLSLVFTVFLGVLAVRGAIAPVADGVALRTAKFVTSNFVPVIGSMFANAVEVVVGGSLLIKNTIGVFGLLVIFFLVALPIIKIWAIILIYKIIGALIEPICDPRINEALTNLGSSLTLVMVSLATVALMFFLAITILIGFGNLAAVMR